MPPYGVSKMSRASAIAHRGGAQYAQGYELGDAVGNENVRDLGCALWSVRQGGELVVIQDGLSIHTQGAEQQCGGHTRSVLTTRAVKDHRTARRLRHLFENPAENWPTIGEHRPVVIQQPLLSLFAG